MKSLNYLMVHILYQIFQDYFEYIIKKHKTFTDNPPVRVYVNKRENRIKFKTRCYLELRSKITKDRNGEKMPHLEINDVD